MKKQMAIIVLCFLLLLGSQLVMAEGGKIAFSKLIDGKWQIVVTDESGQNMINLSNNDVNDSEPSWSFDGKYIAFVSDRDGNSPVKTHIYIMDADGSNQHRVTKKHESPDINEHCPSFSPDGRKLAFTRQTASWNKDFTMFRYDSKIYTIDIDGGNESYLADGWGAKWSPDGNKIIFTPFKDDFFVDDIVTVNADGKKQVEITNDGRNTNPSWSRDSNYIAFSRFDERPSLMEVYKMDSDGNNVMRLTGGGMSWFPSNPSWSPDGKYIVFWDCANTTSSTMWKIYKVSADGGDSIPISEGGCRNPSWSNPASMAVNPVGKLATTWGGLK